MRVIFRFKNGFRKEEDWNDKTELLQYFKLLKPTDAEYIDSELSREELLYESWSFRLSRTYLDEFDNKVAIYDYMGFRL